MVSHKIRSPLLAAAVLFAGAAAALAQAPADPQTTAPARPQPTLKVGDPAPPIKVEKWLKGKPVDLTDGRVHVVEFWATWCGPCKLAMPKVSELAAKYAGKVSVVGVSIWEKGDDYMPAVERFVSHANESMAYNVAAGGGENAEMGNTWMRASGLGGIPAVFVVDRKGRIAWTGHVFGLDEAIALAVEDKLDALAAAKLDAELKERSRIVGGWREEFLRARSEGDHTTILALADKIVDNAYHMVVMAVPPKYIALANTDPEAAQKYGHEVLAKYWNAPMVLSSVSRAITDENSKITGTRDYALAVKLLDQAAKSMEVTPQMQRTREMALSNLADKK